MTDERYICTLTGRTHLKQYSSKHFLRKENAEEGYKEVKRIKEGYQKMSILWLATSS